MNDRSRSARLAWAAVGSAVVLGALLGAAGPAAGHGFHLSVDPQVSDDGTVAVETMFAMADGFVVLHADDDGPGDPVGHVPVTPGYRTGVEITADAEFWAGASANETLWVALHPDDGDGQFDPAADPIARFAGSEAADRVHVRKRDRGRTYVLSEGRTQRAPTPAVYVRRVGLAEDGFVVLRTASGEDGRVVGHVPLDSGVHRHVRVPLDESFFASADDWTTLRAAVHYDDGDGEFSGDDPPVTVEGHRVASRLTVQKTDGSRVTPTRSTGAPRPSPGPDATATSAGSPVTTATPGFVITATPTPDGSPTASSTDTPGFGILAAGVTVATAVLVLRRR